MHQSFVTTAPLTYVHHIHHSPAKSPALRGPSESYNPALYNSKFHGVYLQISALHLPGTAGKLEKSLPRTLARPRRWGGGWGAVVTNDWCINCEVLIGILCLDWFLKHELNLFFTSSYERRHAKRGLNVINDVPRKWRRKLTLICAPILFITRVSNFAVWISCIFSPWICSVCIEVFPTEGPSYPIISHTTILFTLTTDIQNKFT